MVCVICIKNPATDVKIQWCHRKGFICKSCLEKTWTCSDCSRIFYTGDNKGFKPRHNVSKEKNSKECHGWKSQRRRNYEKKWGWL